MSAEHETGDAKCGETGMKPNSILHLEDAAFALLAATVLVAAPVAAVVLNLL